MYAYTAIMHTRVYVYGIFMAFSSTRRLCTAKRNAHSVRRTQSLDARNTPYCDAAYCNIPYCDAACCNIPYCDDVCAELFFWPFFSRKYRSAVLAVMGADVSVSD